MPQISVARQADGTFRVEVHAGRTQTSHVVTVPGGLREDIGSAGVSDEDLVRASFEFLLEREPPSSILRRFSLDEIGHYFPEYREQIGARLREQGTPR